MADATSFDIYDEKGTKVVDAQPKPVVNGLTSNTQYAGYKAAVAGKTAADDMLDLPADKLTTTPGKPALTVTAGDGQVDFTITPAAGDGAVARTYTVSHSIDGKTFTDEEEATVTGTITGLTNGTEYTFKVVAKNVSGPSTESDTVTATPTASSPKV